MTMMIQEGTKSKQIVIVVLDGIKVSTGKAGVAPLCRAMCRVPNPGDEILVLNLLHMKVSEATSDAGFDEVHCCSQSCESYIRFLHQEINERKDVYLRIFKPFYRGCKSNGVKFQVKIAAGFRVKDIIIEEANNVKATWIVLDRCFARHFIFRLNGTDCSVSLVSDDEEPMVHNHFLAEHRQESSIFRDEVCSPRAPEPMGTISTKKSHVCRSLPAINSEWQPCSLSVLATTCNESENQTMHEPDEDSDILRKVKPPAKRAISQDTINLQQKKHDSIQPNKANILLGLPLQLSWKVIMEITQGFKSRIRIGQNKNDLTYYGYLEDHKSFVLVKRLKGDSGSILEAEKKAALFMHHKNIMCLIGYHGSENDTVLVFPFEKEGTLDKYLYDLNGKQWELTFKEKLNIALGTAQGVRYMHEDCPRGPIVHGGLQPSTIFLTSDLQPMISGFGHATWLQLEQECSFSDNRCQPEDSLDHGSMALTKSDVFSFGILLLRLFCRRSMPRDDKILIEWARPLLLQRAFHELLDEDSVDLDMHAIYRVMTAATLCTKTKPISRPSMSEVISILKGDNFCAMQSSPSDNSG